MPAARLSPATVVVAFVLLAATVACLWGRDSYLIGSAWWALRWIVGLIAGLLLVSAVRSRRRLLASLCAATLGLTLTGVSARLAR